VRESETRIIIKVEEGKNNARRQLLKNDAHIYILSPFKREELLPGRSRTHLFQVQKRKTLERSGKFIFRHK
jgi:hypothetical protein